MSDSVLLQSIESTINKLKKELNDFKVEDYYDEVDYAVYITSFYNGLSMFGTPVADSDNILQGSYEDFKKSYTNWLKNVDKELCMEYVTLQSEIEMLEKEYNRMKEVGYGS